MSSGNITQATSSSQHAGLRWGPLLTLSAAGFLAIFTETIPAGLLPQIAAGLNIGAGAAGQLVTLYALGSMLAAIPLIAATRRHDRKHVLLVGITGLLIFNTLTAVAPWYPLVLIARGVAGAAAALIWSVIAGYARHLSSPGQQGRALTIAGIGQPIALALGVPLGAWAGSLLDWRWVFILISVLALALACVVVLAMPKAPGVLPRNSGVSAGLVQALARPGVRTVLFLALLWVLAHNVLYTYIEPILAPTGLRIELGLMAFGAASFVGITVTGIIIDTALRRVIIVALTVMALASATLLAAIPSGSPMIALIAVIAWGISFGGAPSLLQTTLADRSGPRTDAAQSVFVTVFNLAVAGGGILGGLLLTNTGPTTALTVTAAALACIALAIAWGSKVALPQGRRAP